MKGPIALDAEARRLIDLAHPEPLPSEEACQRMDLKLSPLLAQGPGSLLLEPSIGLPRDVALDPRVPLSARLTQRLTGALASKVSVGAASVALIVGAFWLGRSTSPSERRSVESSHSLEGAVVARSDSVAPPEAAAAMQALAEPSDTGALEALPAIAPATSDSLLSSTSARRHQPADGRDDITLLGEVELVLRQGSPELALTKLTGLGRSPPARITQLARVLRAVALCDAGRLDEGKRLVAQLQEKQATSVFAARLERACADGR